MVANIGGNLSKRTYEGMINSGFDFKKSQQDFFLANLDPDLC